MPSMMPDITEEFGGDIGLPTTPPISVPPSAPGSVAWEVSIAGLTFNLAMSDQYPFRRETGEFRRQRIDTERNPGEQSLDSGFWLRSQSSWHYGAGLTSAEPLEVSQEEAQFRYVRGGGINPWVAGQVTLLNDVTSANASGVSGQLLLGVGTGVLHAQDTGLTYIASGGSTTAVTWGGSTNPILSLTSDGGNYYAANSTGIYKGTLPTGVGTLLWNTGGSTLIRWVKSRLMAAVGASLYELVGGTPPALPTALFTHPVAGWTWTDMAEGPTAIYVSGYAGDTSMIYRIDVTATSTTVTLSQPTVVAELPRGEKVVSLYSYLGAYLVVGTSKGARIALIDTFNDGALRMGPLVVRSDDGCYDAVADDSFVYVTVGSKGSAGNRVSRAGLWRIDLSTNLNQNPLDFAAAADMVAPSGTAGEATQVTTAAGKIYFLVDGTGVFKQSDDYVAEGWLETGRIRLGTLEAKAWRDLRLTMQPDAVGTVRAYASLSDLTAPSGWTLTTTVNGDNYDVAGTLTAVAPNRQGSLFAAIRLTTTDTAETPVFTGYQVRAIPAPERSELISVPVLMFDWETDRQGLKYGKQGGAWERYSYLKQLEQAAATVTYIDNTTGERAEAYIERVSLNRVTPPSRGFSGAGGVCQVLLRLV